MSFLLGHHNTREARIFSHKLLHPRFQPLLSVVYFEHGSSCLRLNAPGFCPSRASSKWFGERHTSCSFRSRRRGHFSPHRSTLCLPLETLFQRLHTIGFRLACRVFLKFLSLTPLPFLVPFPLLPDAVGLPALRVTGEDSNDQHEASSTQYLVQTIACFAVLHVCLLRLWVTAALLFDEHDQGVVLELIASAHCHPAGTFQSLVSFIRLMPEPGHVWCFWRDGHKWSSGMATVVSQVGLGHPSIDF